MMPPLRHPALELAEVVRRHGHRLGDLSGEHARILTAIGSCRTAAPGGHVQNCDHYHHRRIAYNSCRNRHCPKCQGSACARWMADRANELLSGVEYFHVVFTLPDTFNPLALGNKRVVYNVLFKAVAQTLLQVAANPKHLGARIGFLPVLHTWGQNLSLHPHVHCVVPGGGIAPADGKRWVACRAGFFLPVRVLSRVFRGKFIDGLRRAWAAGKLQGLDDDDDDDRAFDRLIDRAVKHDWVVYAKPPFGGPGQVLKYLSRYTHRIAISDRRLRSIDDHSVTFNYKDYARGGNRSRTMTLDGREFLRRFLLHAVPRGFMRLRHFGLLAKRVRAKNLDLPAPAGGAGARGFRRHHRRAAVLSGLRTRTPDRRPAPRAAATRRGHRSPGQFLMTSDRRPMFLVGPMPARRGRHLPARPNGQKAVRTRLTRLVRKPVVIRADRPSGVADANRASGSPRLPIQSP